MFSLYGIRNIGNSLEQWQKEFNTIYSLISKDKRDKFAKKFVKFIVYTIYNAKKYTNDRNEYDLAKAHYSYVKRIPECYLNYSENNVEYIKQVNLEVNRGHFGKLRDTKKHYIEFAKNFIDRAETL